MFLIFPLNGKGIRFQSRGYKTSKPLLEIGGKRLIDWVLECYPINLPATKHRYLIRPELASEMPHGAIIINRDTDGPLQTIFSSADLIEELVDSDEGVLVCDCDSLISQEELYRAIEYFGGRGYDGGTMIRRSENPSFSYFILDGDWNVVESINKPEDPSSITDWSSTGPYWFKNGHDFVRFASEALDSDCAGISDIYNYYIKSGRRIGAFPTRTFEHLGTPDELYDWANTKGIEVPREGL